MTTKDKATEIIKKRYNRFTPLYNLLEGIIERPDFSRWRELLWSKVTGAHILEVDVGTGKNFPYYPPDAEVTAIDLSEGMLERAQDKASEQKVKVRLKQTDVQNLKFADNTFDTIVASCGFCTVPDPIQGLRGIERVSKAGGKIVLLEHVLSAGRIAGFLMNLLNSLAVLMIGDNLNRRTVENVTKSSLIIAEVTDLKTSIIKLIEARKLA